MSEPKGVILDLDGTLYQFRGVDGTFGGSDFYDGLKNNMYSYLAEVIGLTEEAAKAEYERIKDMFNGEVSLGVEQELGIDRYDWFGNTWNLNPADYLDPPRAELAESLASLEGRAVVLTAAPAAWAYPALEYLGISDLFNRNVLTGEPDIRKPNPAVFKQAANVLQRQCCEVVSVGDQNSSDILPAKQLGMLTVKIGLEAEDADYFASDIYGALQIVKKI